MPDSHDIKSISIPTIRRLPVYHHYLEKLKKTGVTTVSATTIARALQQQPIQVRKDLAITGIIGKPKVGFDIDELLDAIKEVLGWKNNTDLILIGCGNLGTALIGYSGFKKYGINIVAAFDNDRRKIGRKIQDVPVLHIDKMKELCQRLHIEIGILTVSVTQAQQVADLMVDAGILAIWNFVAAALKVPEGVAVQQHDMAASLAILLNKYDQLK
ncbi:MAG: redox-sensing transcriptional repressor Rex [Spirochaetes bacterium]|nr:redox-sensing transcriptional repressor Rex [Spirochaetota bacterium]